MNLHSLLVVAFTLLPFLYFSQTTERALSTFLDASYTDLKVEKSDLTEWEVTDAHTDRNSGITYAYIRQKVHGIPVYNATANFAIHENQVVVSGNRLTTGLAGVQKEDATIRPEEAIAFAAKALELEGAAAGDLIEKDKQVRRYDKGTLSNEDIPVQLVYAVTPTGLKLCWDISIYPLEADHWWSIRIDAQTGDEVDRNDWVSNCNFDGVSFHNHNHEAQPEQETEVLMPMPAPPPSTDQYNVFALPVESPNHGGRSLVVGPYDPVSSPYGWHDDNGAAGAEYTITRGNNVYATEDQNNDNNPGYAPDGGAALDFDFTLNMNQAASNYVDPAVTNLFYMNNVMHDVWYHYGFDEASGNFQENNYGNGGSASDYVNADAQDGGGMNNANFATPTDGNNPRMQMYLWSNPGPKLLTVNSPSAVAGSYQAVQAGFGPALTTTPITTDLVIYDDNVPDNYDACETAVNAAAMNGKIVLIRRGTCSFVNKVTNAQNAGAVAVIMVNNTSGAPITMGGTSGTITIPSVMVSDIDGEALIAAIEGGSTVNATLVDQPAYDLDGDFDNGIIAHEYGHGISTRLTGGASNSNCLNNNEQMGEGWSDWFALMMTMDVGDIPTDNRGIGTWVTGESPSGVGIRPAPYNTDFAVNNYTYDATNNNSLSVPHGIGFVWCTMLWDMTWALVDQYGFDPDLYNGTGGNNMAMHLVIEGLKLQPCSPGFVDGRDAILLADQMLYGGANQCLLWNVFANRGLGYSADQGSSNNRSDQTEAFDLPSWVQNVSTTVNQSACGSYTWSANGTTYTSSGTYTETILSYAGCDSTVTLNLTITGATSGPTTYASDCASYTWAENGQTYTTSGVYQETLTASNGCDSVVTLDLTISGNLSGPTQYVTNCGSYTWAENGQTYASTGVYQATLTGSNGCDSTVTLDLTVAGTTSGPTQFVTNCGSYTWAENGQTYASSGVYQATLTGSNGCDSTIALDLTVLAPTSGPSEFVTNCGAYTWAATGSTYSTSGQYQTTLTGSNGCDSIATLELTVVGPTTGPTQYITDCNSYTWAATGTTYSTSGVYQTTLTGSNGCDSTATLDLTIGTTYATDVQTACGSYTWIDGNTYASNNSTATHTITNSNGCDSVITLNLTVNQIYSQTEVVNSCSSYTWPTNGQTYSTSGNYTANLSTVNGCDSTITLSLTIANVASSTETATSCSSYYWATNGTTYTNSGQYVEILTGQGGCDSTVTLNLTITQPSSATETAAACGSYYWTTNGTTYTNSGQYMTTLTNSNGCDSVVTLDLTITQASAPVTTTVNACDSYTWNANNTTYTTSGTYSETLVNAAGCDSLVTLDLTLNFAYSSTETLTTCDSYIWGANGQTYTNSGNYQVVYTTSAGCDSTLNLNLTIETVTASVNMVDEVTLSAAGSAGTYQWINCDNNVGIAGATNQVFAPASNGTYAVVITSGNCADTSNCVTIDKIGLDEFEAVSITVFPNPNDGHFSVSFGTEVQKASMQCYDAIGQLIDEKHMESGQQMDWVLDVPPGVYFLRVSAEGVDEEVIKVLKE